MTRRMILTAYSDWPAVMSQPGWMAVIEQRARATLEPLDGARISTGTLGDRLYPIKDVRGPEALAARSQLLRALLWLADHGLSDCATRGQPTPNRWRPGTVKYPWLWHKSTGVRKVETCPRCHQPIQPKEI